MRFARSMRNIKVRLISVFIAFAVVIVIIIGVSLNIRIQSTYYATFKDGIVSGFDRWLQKNGWNYGNMRDVGIDEVRRLLSDNNEAKIYFYLVSSFRTYTLLSIDGKEIVASNDKLFDGVSNDKLLFDLLSSKNVLTVMAGADKGGNTALVRTKDGAFFDYAIRLDLAEGDYILYFKYDRQEWSNVLDSFTRSILSSLAIAILAALFMGVLFSQTITVPIIKIRDKAKQLAAGDFDALLDVRSGDEIGDLTNTFNHMAMELKSNLLEISSEKSKVETILAYMTDGVVAFSLAGDIIHINPAARKMLGIDPGETNFDAFAKKFDLDVKLGQIVNADDKTGKEVTFTYEGKYIHAYFAMYYDEARNVGGIVSVFQDNTEQQRMDRLRKEFVANVSHELRTPITAIKSYSETLLEPGIDDKTRTHFLDVINSEVDRMALLVRDLLQLSSLDYIKSKGDEGYMKLNMSTFLLSDLVRNCIEKTKMDLKDERYEIGNNVVGDAPEVTADYNRMEQVLLNILGNAVKYMPEGGRITVFTGMINDCAYVRVIDTGIGISKEDLSRVFERFYRVDKARTREMGGTGLGLAIAKEIMDVHGGDIDIASEWGKGTEVTVKLPLRQKKHVRDIE